MPVEVRRMRHVIALAGHAGVARVAAALRRSQPAPSRSIHTVEEDRAGIECVMVASLICVEHEPRARRLVVISCEPYLRTNSGVVEFESHPDPAATGAARRPAADGSRP